MRISNFIPAFLYRLLSLPQPKKQNTVPVLISYASFFEAIQNSEGYTSEKITKVVFEKTRILQNNLSLRRTTFSIDRQQVQNLFVIQSTIIALKNVNQIGILDIGGACGAGFIQLPETIKEKILRWHVLETQSMSDSASLLASSQLQFFSVLENAVAELQRDLLYASGVLQYLPDPLSALKEWVTLDFSYLYLTRTLISEEITAPIVSLQKSRILNHGVAISLPGWLDEEVSFPYTVVPRQELENILTSKYEIIFSFDEEGSTRYVLNDSQVEIKSVGYYCKKKD